MAKLIFNKSTATEAAYEVDNINEYLFDKLLVATKHIAIAEGESVPSIPTPASRDISSIAAEDSTGKVIPVVGSYNYISEFTTNYYEEEKAFSYTIRLTEKSSK